MGLADEVVASLSPVLATQVWTCEVGECGASLCSVECDARNCATLNWAVKEDPSGRFPMALPKIFRNLSEQAKVMAPLLCNQLDRMEN